ncbi:FTR1 family protein [Rhodanobacter ginsenosidimutans]|uniref:FTR1 family protein n=1 Tax=Rhodanobacter ginsenosidimutans TaxID=490571 RepID=A0ABW0JWM6_9GAMM
MTPRHLFAALLLATLLFCPRLHAAVDSVPTTWRLLDYIAVDYREAVRDGAVVNQVEYQEMQEFSATAAAAIKALPPTPDSAPLNQGAVALQQAIRAKSAPEEIATRARAVAALLIKAYPIPLMPTSAPQYARGQTLYAQQCASCHGATGAGNGPAAAGLDPPPIDFTDRARADERSIFALYQVIDQGLQGTSMPSFASLPAEDRWALATYVGALAYPESEAEAGRELLEKNDALRARLDFKSYVDTTPATLATELQSAQKAAAIVAYVRRHPEATRTRDAESALAVSHELLRQAMVAYRGGQLKQAKDLALSAYLDGFEPVEPLLAARDAPLMAKIEEAMAGVRAGIGANVDADTLQTQVDRLDDLYAEAGQVLAQGETSAVASFAAAFTILLREGLEALLIVVAIIALLRKAGRREMLPWVHGGWLSALGAGAVTWGLATWVVSISGASRELTEGFGSLLAAIVLIWVGIWMHGKSHAENWQRYVRDKLGHALSKTSGVFLLGLIFVVVYREVFETILFYVAIWNQGSKSSVIAGGVAGSLVLMVIGWLMMRYSRRLPISQFFRYSSVLMAVLAVVLMGKAVSALQEAGYLPITWINGGPRVELLGIYPTMEGIAAQVGIALVLVVGFVWSNRSAGALKASDGTR